VSIRSPTPTIEEAIEALRCSEMPRGTSSERERGRKKEREKERGAERENGGGRRV
jgi:hypothetical protein